MSRWCRGAAVRPGAVPTVAVLAGVIAVPAQAAPWGLEPSLALASQSESNPLYDTVSARSAWSATVVAAAPISWQDANARLALSPQATAGASYGAGGLGTDDRRVSLDWSESFGRGSFAASGAYSRVRLFSVQTPDVGLNRNPGTTQAARSAGATLTWQTSERGTLSATATWLAQAYSKVTSEALSDYHYSAAVTQFGYAVTPRLTWFVVGSAGRYQVVDSDIRSTFQSVQTGLTYTLSERSSLKGTIGSNGATLQPGSQRQSGLAYSLSGALKPGERSQLSLGASQSVQPSALQTLVVTKTVALTDEIQVSERFSLNVSVSDNQAKSSFFGFATDRRDFRRASIGGGYALTRLWRVSGGLDFTQAVYPRTILQPASISARSGGGSLSLTRSFDRIEFD